MLDIDLQVCGDSVENFSFDATIDASTATDQASMIGTQCSIAGATSSGDYITIECTFLSITILLDV